MRREGRLGPPGDVFEPLLNGRRGIALVGSNHAGRAALDPARNVESRRDFTVAKHASFPIRNDPLSVVEGQTIDGNAAVADRSEYEAERQRFESSGSAGHEPALVVLRYLVVLDSK